MQFIRAILFNMFFYTFSAVMMIGCSVHVFLLPRKYGKPTVDSWCRGNMWLEKFFCGVKVEFRGQENIPKGGLLIASKHQSSWDTFGLIPEFLDPAYIYKRELGWIPAFGWYVLKWKMIPIDRKKGSKAIPEMIERSRAAVNEGRQILIFPEGTRRPIGAKPAYKQGIARLYSQLNVPVLPVALNTGIFWPRRSLLHYPGTHVVEFLPPIQPGLSEQEFMDVLIERIETATEKLRLEVANGENPPPTCQVAA